MGGLKKIGERLSKRRGVASEGTRKRVLREIRDTGTEAGKRIAQRLLSRSKRAKKKKK